MIKQFFIFSIILLFPAIAFAQAPRTIHVFVALADNAHQGIVPVPAKIGNGDDPANNLYWGCDEGLKSCFKKSAQWKIVRSQNPHTSVVLERCVFKHVSSNTYLVADAYRGREIKTAIEDFLKACGAPSTKAASMKIGSNEKPVELKLSAGADLVAYIGHNGLMDFNIRLESAPTPSPKPVMVLCCKSRDYFGDLLKEQGASPILMTTQLMYPGSFILKAALDGWLSGESQPQIKTRAAHAYAKNQNIGIKSALGVFAP